MMRRYDLMTYSDVMRQWERRSVRNKHYQFAPGVLPEDRTWEVVLAAAAVVVGFVVMFVRWWIA